MEILSNPISTTAQITYHKGIDDEGKDRTSTRSLTGIKPAETDGNIYSIVNSLNGLQKHPSTMILRIDRAELEED